MQPSIVAAALNGVEVLPIADHGDVGNPLTNKYLATAGHVSCLTGLIWT